MISDLRCLFVNFNFGMFCEVLKFSTLFRNLFEMQRVRNAYDFVLLFITIFTDGD